MKYNRSTIILTLITVISLSIPTVEACSRLLWNINDTRVMSGRTFDWYHSLGSLIYINPRGTKMDGGEKKNPYSWTSKYGSVTTAISTYLMQQGDFSWEDGATDGINEKGLAAHALYLQGSVFVHDEKDLPAINTLRWVRYILDNFASVDEALAAMQHIHIAPGILDGNPMSFHMAMEDSSGDSAIIEFVNGIKTIKHGAQYTVLTNNPPYTEQVENLKNYETFGGNKPLPGNVSSEDRFVRLSYYSKFLPETNFSTFPQSHLLSVMRTAASPFGAPYTSGASYPTWWISLSDLTNLQYFFTAVEAPNLIQIDVTTIDFEKGSGIRWLDPRNQKLFGIVNTDFKPLSELKIQRQDSISTKRGAQNVAN
ncbi:linear amide C-N hydrolase [Kordiimonas pumila]|uniref:Linear amide C-N hydrolase n=1 Tax=Kordiimonas pumila TaxID=2161677 RepID=A0ABV7D4B0_9PROT|nr:linear amide C-N hydrolase [Kordiimonas pumila]